MERNPNDTQSSGGTTSGGPNAGSGNSALGSGTDSISVTGTGAGQSAATGSTTTGGNVGSLDLGHAATGAGPSSMADRLSGARGTATDKLAQARDAATERIGQARERASQLSATLADKLEAGAQSLRQPGTPGAPQFAGMSATAQSDAQLDQLKHTGAAAMQKAAEFLRSGDLKASVETQMRDNPGRTLLFALGAGYLLGRAIRGGDRR